MTQPTLEPFATTSTPSATSDLPLPTTPIVKLINSFQQPFNNAVATARTCYSSRVIYAEEVGETEDRRKQRDQIAASTYKAGHHTTLQHANFQFVLERVSRQLLWSFLHAHPFYNSEQVSQRYVEVKAGSMYYPALPERAFALYHETAQMQMKAYHSLIELLHAPVTTQYRAIFPHRDQGVKKWQSAIKKRALEVARYVLPVGTVAHLYHTVNGITLFRYQRLCRQLDVPTEATALISAMVREVESVDPTFFSNLEDPIPLEETLEYQTLSNLGQSSSGFAETRRFLDEFDATLGNRSSVMVGYSSNGQENLAQSVRSVLGLPKDRLSDEEAIGLLLDPRKNHYLAGALNLNSLAKLPRGFHHLHLTFRKKISHTADSQDQRHRLTPGSRPVLSAHFVPDRPDYILPPLVAVSAEAEDFYHEVMRKTWHAITTLLEMGVETEKALYLLPNAFPIRFEESGDLMGFHHKWTTRLCYTAQEEIWSNCRDEVLQVRDQFPLLGKWLFPPCTLRKIAGETPYCPEGERFCGVRVWNLDVDEFERLL